MEWVYMLECGDGSLYTGWTNDLDKRLAAHQSGRGAKYTRSRAPVRLAYTEQCADKSAALRREAALKALPRARKLALARQWRAEESQMTEDSQQALAQRASTQATEASIICDNVAESTGVSSKYAVPFVSKREHSGEE